MAIEKRVRVMPAHYDGDARQITVSTVLSYLKGEPLGEAELSEDQALALAESLLRAVQSKRLDDARRAHRRRPPDILS